jgi:hypothetical protein
MGQGESEKHEHEGDFAEGIEETERHVEDAKGDFAEGVEERKHRHEGDFAEGIEETEHHPEDEKKGDFAEGVEADPAAPPAAGPLRGRRPYSSQSKVRVTAFFQ